MNTRRPTFKPNYGIEHPTARRARAGFWLVQLLAILAFCSIVIGACYGLL